MSFKNWCLEKYGTKNAQEATHLFMDKGKIKVPMTEYKNFLKKYYISKDVENISLVEKLGKNIMMRFFLDIDMKNVSQKVEKMCEIVSVGNEILYDAPIISECSDQQGYHIIYNKICSCEESERYATQIKEKSKYGNYIDTSVYRTGLRMIGSVKGQELRRYTLKDDNFETFKHSVVRICENEMIENNKQIETNENNKQIETNEKNEIKRVIKIIWNMDLDITSVKNFANHKTYLTNSKYCMNIKNEHKNSKVYFVFNKKTKEIYQKCFCRCDKGVGPFMRCMNYKSKSEKVPYLFDL